MKVLFDIGHPAHVHLFKTLIRDYMNSGAKVVITARDKDITLELLDAEKFPYKVISKAKKNILGMFFELFERNIKIAFLHFRERFDVAFGTSVSIGHLTLFSKIKSYVFSEDDDDVVPLYAILAYPFATKIFNPIGTRFKFWSKKRVFYNSYHELAYLHPDHFNPKVEIIESYGLRPYEYVLIRKSALMAHHDIGKSGIDNQSWDQIKKDLSGYHIVESKEGVNGKAFQFQDIHHILSFAKFIITDSQTMTMEAAILGVPSVRYNSFVGKISCIEELEHKYELTYGFFPGNEELLMKKIRFLSQSNNLHSEWNKKKKILLNEKVNFHKWIKNWLEKEQSL